MQILAKVQWGSRLYGTDIETSDVDHRTIFLPSLKDCVAGRIKDAWEDKSEEDTSYFSLQHFLRLASEGQSIALELLAAPPDKVLATSNVWDFLQRSRNRFYTKNINSFIGFAKSMSGKYSTRIDRLTETENILRILRVADMTLTPCDIDHRLSEVWDLLPESLNVEKGTNERSSGPDKRVLKLCGRELQITLSIPHAIKVAQGIYDSYGDRVRNAKEGKLDYKALAHAFRVAFQCREIIETKDLKFPLYHAGWLRNLRLGKFDFSEYKLDEQLDELIVDIQAKMDTSDLPEKADPEFAREVIYRAYDEYFGTNMENGLPL